MGKHFYGTHAEKDTAMKLADNYAKKYKKGKCYTPSSRISNSCVFNETTLLWTCRASAHHHWGSCGSKEITSDPGRGTGSGVNIPIITWDQQNEANAIGNDVGLDLKKQDNGEEIYTDALPGDYEENE